MLRQPAESIRTLGILHRSEQAEVPKRRLGMIIKALESRSPGRKGGYYWGARLERLLSPPAARQNDAPGEAQGGQSEGGPKPGESR